MRDDFFDDVELEDSDSTLTRLAYIKVIDLNQARALGAMIPSEIELPLGMKLYALHGADGTTIGITDNWAAAYSAAVHNNLVPVSVH
jgi:hypothetical protein